MKYFVHIADRQPRATALLYTVRSLGGTLGISLGASSQLGLLSHLLRLALPDGPERQATINAILHSSKSAIRSLPQPIQDAALKAYGQSLSYVWIGCGGVACLTLASACFVEEREMGPVKDRGRRRGWGRSRAKAAVEDGSD